MELNPAELRDVFALVLFALVLAGLLFLVGSVALIDIRRELRRLRREVRTTTHAVRHAADDALQRSLQQDLHPRAGHGSTQPTSKEEQT